MKNLRKFASSLLALASVFLLAACGGGGVSQSSYEKLKPGMTATEVEAILGKPTETGGAGIGGISAGAKTWKDGDKEITVMFTNEKVSTFTKKGF